MPRRAHKVLLSQLACLGFKLNAELDKGSHVSLDDAFKAARETRVIAFIRERFGNSSTISALDSEDEITISEYFDSLAGALCPKELGVHTNGLCWLLALTIQMMQNEQWATFDDPTNPQS